MEACCITQGEDDMGVDVQVDRPVTIKANGKTIKLTNDEARELARKLNAALSIRTSPNYPWYPWYPHTTYPDNDATIWYGSTSDITLGASTSSTHTVVEPISIDIT